MTKNRIEQVMEGAVPDSVVVPRSDYWRNVPGLCKECGWTGDVPLAPGERLFCGNCAGPYVVEVKVGDAS